MLNSYSNLIYSRKKIKCTECDSDSKCSIDGENIFYFPPKCDTDEPLYGENLKLPLNVKWKENIISDPCFVDISSLEIIDFVIEDLLANCYAIIQEKKSYSLRNTVYEKKLSKVFEEFEVMLPQCVPARNPERVYQNISKGLFGETFSEVKTCENSEVFDDSEGFEMEEKLGGNKKSLQMKDIIIDENTEDDFVKSETENCSFEPCDLHERAENDQELLANGIIFKKGGKNKFFLREKVKVFFQSYQLIFYKPKVFFTPVTLLEVFNFIFLEVLVKIITLCSFSSHGASKGKY